MVLASEVVDLCLQLATQINHELSEQRKQKSHSRSQQTIYPRQGLADIPDRSIYIRDSIERAKRHQQWLEACQRQQELQNNMEIERLKHEAAVKAERELRKQEALKAKTEKDRLERIKDYAEFKQRKIQMKVAVEKFRLSRLSSFHSVNEPIDGTLATVVNDTFKENIPPGGVSGLSPSTSAKQISTPLTEVPVPPRKRISRKRKVSVPIASIASIDQPDPAITDVAIRVAKIPVKRGRPRKNNPKIHD